MKKRQVCPWKNIKKKCLLVLYSNKSKIAKQDRWPEFSIFFLLDRFVLLLKKKSNLS